MWQDKKYQFISLFIYLYEDHLIWDEVGFAGRQFTLYYTDIISVSGGNAGRHLGGTSRFEINTAGQTYKYSSTLGAFAGLEECIQTINERIQYFRNNGVGSTNSAGFANNININPDNIEPTITRIDLFLEDGEWGKVRSYANAALDYFPTDYRLYKYLLLADTQCKSVGALKNSTTSFASNSNYKKLDRYADESLKKELKDVLEYIEKEPIYKQAKGTSDKEKALDLFKGIRGYKDSDDYISSLQTRIKEDVERKKEKEEHDKESKYQDAIQMQNRAETLDDYKKALNALEELKGNTSDHNAKRHYDVVNRYNEVKAKCEELQAEEDYLSASELLASGEISKVRRAEKIFESLNEYEDSKEKYGEAKGIIEKYSVEKQRKKKKVFICLAICIVVAIAGGIIINQNNRAKSYEKAKALYEAEQYIEAKDIFDAIGDYKDSDNYAQECAKYIALEEQYQTACEALENADYEVAIAKFESIKGYKDSAKMEQISRDYSGYYNSLTDSLKDGDFVKAKENLDQISDHLERYIYDSLDSAISNYNKWSGTYKLTGEPSWGFSWGDADDYNIHVKVTVNDVEINSDLKEVSLEPYMRLDFKDTITSISPIEFDEWDKGENCFKNFGYSSKNYLTAVRNEENGNLEFKCGMDHSTYKKTS